jgi:hypothetical protein
MSDESATSKAKIIVVVVAVASILVLILVGVVTSKPAAVAPQATTLPDPAPVQTAQITSFQVDTAVQPTFGPRLPFAVSSAHSADLEVEGSSIVRGKVEMPNNESGNVDRLANADNQTWVVMPMQANHKRSLLGQSIATAQRVLIPMLFVDGTGLIEPVGFAYQDATTRVVQVEPDFGLRGMSQTPELFPNRDDQQLWLLFRVPSGSYITQLQLGRQVIAVWSPPMQVK